MIDAGKIKVEQNILTMLAGDNPTFRLLPAYRFVKTAENVPDPFRLVGRFRTEQDLKDMEAEIYMDSVIYKDIAYQADPGFIAEQIVAGETAASAPAQTPPKPEASIKKTEAPPAEAAEAPEDPEKLSKFILDNLI